jgi:hypothetical protein
MSWPRVGQGKERTDHMVAWRTRHALNLDKFGTGVTEVAAAFAGDTAHPDNRIFDIPPNPNGGTGISASGFGHATCFNNPPTRTPPPAANSSGLPAVPRRTGRRSLPPGRDRF